MERMSLMSLTPIDSVDCMGFKWIQLTLCWIY